MLKRKMKKVLAGMLAGVMMLVSLVSLCGLDITNEISVSAAYENTYVNTGNQAADIVGVAKTQVGYTEGSNNYTKYNVWLGALPGYPENGYGYAWCQSFVSWCAAQANIPTSEIKRASGTVTVKNSFIDNGTYHTGPYEGGSYIPKAGDIIYFYSAASDSKHHVGIVTACDGSTVYTIEGNSSDKVSERSYSVNNANIRGYGVPNYTNTSTNSETVIFHDSSVSGISSNDAKISTWITNNGGTIFSTGFYIGTDEDNMILYTTHADVGWTEFYDTYQLSDYYGSLSPGQTYYYRFYLILSDGMQYFASDIYSFKTTGEANISYNYCNTSDLSLDSATIDGWTYNSNGYTISSHGFCIGTTTNNMEKYEVYSNIGWTDFYTNVNISDYITLQPDTTYYYKWYSKADAMYYSEIMSFTTTEDIYCPVIQMFYIEDLGLDGYTLVAKVSDNVGVENVTFETWKDDSEEHTVVTGNHSYDDFYCYRFNVDDLDGISDLCHAIVYASDKRNTNSQEMEFTISDYITYNYCTVCDISCNSAVIDCWTYNTNRYTISSYGFCIGTNTKNMEYCEVYSDIAWTDFYTEISIDDYIDLASETTYYYKWYTLVGDKYYYSEIDSFSTSNIPTVTTSITTTTTTTTTTAVIVTTSSTNSTATTTKSTEATTTTSTEMDLLIGDINLDGDVRLEDSVILNKYVAGLVNLSDLAYSNADTNADDYVDADDALVLLKFQVGLVNSLPAEAG